MEAGRGAELENERRVMRWVGDRDEEEEERRREKSEPRPVQQHAYVDACCL